MNDFDIFGFYNQVKHENILLMFKGALSQEILLQIGEFINNRDIPNKQLKRFFSVFVELSQNIMHYSAEREIVGDSDVGVGIILFTEDNNSYKIFSGNQILNIELDLMLKNLENINSLKNDDLYTLFKTQRKKPPTKGSKGAGLGLIEIVRKSNNKIEYRVHEINDIYSFLILTVKIQKEIVNG